MNHCNVLYIMYAADSKGNKEIFYVKEKDQKVLLPDFWVYRCMVIMSVSASLSFCCFSRDSTFVHIQLWCWNKWNEQFIINLTNYYKFISLDYWLKLKLGLEYTKWNGGMVHATLINTVIIKEKHTHYNNFLVHQWTSNARSIIINTGVVWIPRLYPPQQEQRAEWRYFYYYRKSSTMT